MKIPEKAEQILKERFGKDSLIALATESEGTPYVRMVNAYYENGAFYVITHGLSNKIRHIHRNPTVAIAGEWFTAHGQGINLGYWGEEENHRLADKLREAFAAWIDNGHNNFEDRNTIILCIKLTHGTLFSHGTRYDLEF